MIDIVRKLSSSNKKQRLENIITILKKYELPYTIIYDKINNHWVNNVKVPIYNSMNSNKRLVFCAHYDNYEGSTGANDNASGVSILLQLASIIVKMKDRFSINMEFVFFDREEYPDRGSELYVITNRKEDILGVINFDTCGYGNRILLGPIKNIETSLFSRITTKLLDKHRIHLIKRTPGSDDRSFENMGIPNLSVCVVPDKDIPIIDKLIDFEVENRKPTKEEFPNPPEFLSTTHNGLNDAITSVSEQTLKLVYNFAYELLLVLTT